MKKLYTADQIEQMRKKLYDRGGGFEEVTRHDLSDTKIDVSRDWSTEPVSERRVGDLREGVAITPTPPVENAPPEPVPYKPKRRYRSFILLGSLLVFVLVAVTSSAFLYFGGNNIAGGNIQVNVSGQPSVAGGDVQSLQIAVANQNSVPLESAVLILQYPPGTRSLGDSPRNLSSERFEIGTIEPGQVQNIPVRVAVFGEENERKEIQATVEYRVGGSGGTFYKEAEPLAFRISSSPLVLRIDSIEKVASGQLVDITISAVSNASTPLEDLLITAAYPNGFAFESSEPAPVYGQNVWRINSLQPEQITSIKLRGVISGLTDEQFRVNFKAGPINPNNQYLVGATLAEGRADFVIERPFIDVGVAINSNRTRNVTLSAGQKSNVVVVINNTLDETVYDMKVEVVPGGNTLTIDSIKSENGFYDSNRGVVLWEVSNNKDFAQVVPGGTRQVSFTVDQGPRLDNASYELVVNVYARRVAERSAQETLLGTVRAEAKYSSTVAINSQVSKSTAGFIDRGPVPPEVGKESTYTVTLVAEAGANELLNTVMETGLPVYVNWLDTYDADGAVTYNTVSKQLQWNIGDMSPGERKEFTMQLSLTPSVSQVKSSPVLLNTQQIRANDGFTRALLQDSARAVTTELSTEMGFPFKNGEVIR
jgi:hypothetical protein